jgi:hypothetical protein
VRKVETELPPRGEENEGWQEMGQKEVSYSLIVLVDVFERRGGVRTQ